MHIGLSGPEIITSHFRQWFRCWLETPTGRLRNSAPLGSLLRKLHPSQFPKTSHSLSIKAKGSSASPRRPKHHTVAQNKSRHRTTGDGNPVRNQVRQVRRLHQHL